MKERYKHECIECGSNNVVHDRKRNQTTCNDCGAIYEDLTPEEEEREEEVSRKKVPKE